MAAGSEIKPVLQSINDIKTKTKLCIETKKHSNYLIDLISATETEDKRLLLACIKAFHKIFGHFISSGVLYQDVPEDLCEKDYTAEERYTMWLTDRYQDVIDKLLILMRHQNTQVKELSLCTMMRFVAEEGQSPLRKHSDRQSCFPASLCQKVISTLASDDMDLQELIGRFQEYQEYDDVRFHVMKSLLSDIKRRRNTAPGEVYLWNVFGVLETLTFPLLEPERYTNFISRLPGEDSQAKVCSPKEHKKVFSSLWLEFLKFKLPTALYKKVLVMLDDKVIPHFTNPLFLSDFLLESYDVGGAISLLALNGLFVLVHKYNLDYPDFFKKLYALFEPSIFHVKYRARFFFLADLFLTSSHLPAYLVAAFAKRLARISLTAPPSGLTVSVPFIYNLINRHPNCKVLLHRPGVDTDLSNDPYVDTEQDPALCKALDSSLWELKTLQCHYHPDIAKMAQRMEQPLQKDEIPLQDLLETSYNDTLQCHYHPDIAKMAQRMEQPLQKDEIPLQDLLATSYNDLFEKETKKKVKHAPVTFEPPKGILGSKSDKLKLCWVLE